MSALSSLIVKVKHIREFLCKSGILVWVIATIILVIILGSVHTGGNRLVPAETGRIFATFSAISSQLLSFSIPLIIIDLVTPTIASLGRSADKWLGITAAIAHTSTLPSGFLTYLVRASLFPRLLTSTQLADMTEPGSALESYFMTEMPALLQMMVALLLSFVAGLGLSMVPRGVPRKGFIKSRAVIAHLIETIIIPLLPLHIFGIFLSLTYAGEAASVIWALVHVVVMVLVFGVIILPTQFYFAGLIARRNPFKAPLTMMPAYLTVPGTSSSTAVIPVTLRQTKKSGVSDAVASSTAPLCTTIHLAGSTSRTSSPAFAIILTQDLTVSSLQWVGFIFMLDITTVAAPGVPGGAIMAVTGLLSSTLDFNDAQIALVIATYITLDSFGTATNVTGDGATAFVMDRMAHGSIDTEGDLENARELAFDGVAYSDRTSVGGVISPEELAESSARNSSETVA